MGKVRMDWGSEKPFWAQLITVLLCTLDITLATAAILQHLT